MRKRINYVWKVLLIVLLLWIIGFAGVLNLGILGSGVWWMVMSATLASTLYSKLAGIVTLTLSTAVLIIIGGAFITGKLIVPVDANTYIVSVSSWVTLLMATSLMPFFILENVNSFQHTIIDLLKEVHRQRDEIEHLATHDYLTGLPQSKLL
ncbi:MAG: hypothetical protein EXR80_08910 [Methylococcales bacterium]|nr:hypothetical protein [Methylococcales bacterium]